MKGVARIEEEYLKGTQEKPFVDTKLRGNYEFCFSNWDGERYPNVECILFVL